MLLERNDGKVEENLRRLQERYGKEKLEKLSDKELYQVYKEFVTSA